jgi:membrane fusion protein (multidrug efflux system)
VVLDGLKAGEQVMVDGFQKLRPATSPVKPVPWTQQAAGAAPRLPRPRSRRRRRAEAHGQILH